MVIVTHIHVRDACSTACIHAQQRKYSCPCNYHPHAVRARAARSYHFNGCRDFPCESLYCALAARTDNTTVIYIYIHIFIYVVETIWCAWVTHIRACPNKRRFIRRSVATAIVFGRFIRQRTPLNCQWGRGYYFAGLARGCAAVLSIRLPDTSENERARSQPAHTHARTDVIRSWRAHTSRAMMQAHACWKTTKKHIRKIWLIEIVYCHKQQSITAAAA